MEVSSHALAMGRVDGTTYDVAVFTNLSEDHLDFHADLEEYFQVKATLFTPGAVPARCRRRRRPARPAAGRARHRAGGHRVAVGRRAGRRLAGDPTSSSGRPGSTFRLDGPGGLAVDCATALAGDFNLANAALAVVALVRTGVAPDVAAAGVAVLPGRAGPDGAGRDRGRRAARPGRLRAHSRRPGAAAGRGPRPGRRRRAGGGRVRRRRRPRPAQATGDGGDRGARRRRRGAHQRQPAVRGPAGDPRGDPPRGRRGAGRRCGRPARGWSRTGARRCGWPSSLAGPGDVLVVAGKGHETGQEVDGVEHPFDDRRVLADALAAVAR